MARFISPHFSPFSLPYRQFGVGLMIMGVTLSGCFGPADGLPPPPNHWGTVTALELNGTLANGSRTFAAVLPIIAEAPTSLRGEDGGMQWTNSSTQYILVDPAGHLFVDILRPTFATPRYEWRLQDRQEGIDDGECMDPNQSHPCPPRTVVRGDISTPVPRTPTAPNDIPVGEWYFVVLVHNIQGYEMHLNLSRPVAVGDWSIVESTADVFDVGSFDAFRQDWEHCLTSAACGVIEEGRFQFGDQPYPFNTASVRLMTRSHANINVCISGAQAGSPTHCADAGSDLPAPPLVPGAFQTEYLVINWLDRGPFDSADVNAQSSPVDERALFGTTGTYWSVNLPSADEFRE